MATAMEKVRETAMGEAKETVMADGLFVAHLRTSLVSGGILQAKVDACTERATGAAGNW